MLINRRLDDLDADYTLGDLRHGLHQLVGHLAQLGHRRIAFLADTPGRYPVNERSLIRYQLALAAFGLSYDPALVWYLDAPQQTFYDLTVKMMTRLTPPPTAIFPYNDWHATAVIRALTDLGYRVPQDVSVVGYDDLNFSQYYLTPAADHHDPAGLPDRAVRHRNFDRTHSMAGRAPLDDAPRPLQTGTGGAQFHRAAARSRRVSQRQPGQSIRCTARFIQYSGVSMTEMGTSNENLLEVKGLKKYFDIQKGMFGRKVATGKSGGRRELCHSQRPNPGPGGRKRLWKIDHRTGDFARNGPDRRRSLVNRPPSAASTCPT